MNWRGSSRKRMDPVGQILVKNVLNGYAVILIIQLLWIQISDLSSQRLYARGIPGGFTSSSLILCRIYTHWCRVEVETNPSMIQTFLVVDTGRMTGEQAMGNISKSPTFVYIGYSTHLNRCWSQYIYAGTTNSDRLL